MTKKENKYWLLFQSNGDGIIRISTDGQILEANPAFCKMLGYDDISDVLGSYKKHTPPEWHSIEDEILTEELTENGYTEEYDKEYITKDGSIIGASIKLWMLCLPDTTHEIWGIVRDISKQRHKSDRFSASVDQLRDLNHHLAEAREKERKSIAAAIHDEIGQTMTALKLELELLKQNSDFTQDWQQKLDKLVRMTGELISKTQRISGEIRPGVLDSLGFQAAVDWYCNEWTQRTGIRVHKMIDDCYINKKTELALFRIVQEALTNIARHSRARKAEIVLQHKKEQLYLSIADDGTGIPKEKMHSRHSYGLLGMQERAESCGGKLRVSSGSGTRIEASIDFNMK